MIHGGLESSWTSAGHIDGIPNYLLTMDMPLLWLIPMVQRGFSTPFREAVRNDFGGVTFEDIINGLKYAIKNNNYMDSEKVCAAWEVMEDI